MAKPKLEHTKYLLISSLFHLGILLILILGFDYTTSLPVFENSNKNDIISAVALGDHVKSKILPKKILATSQVKPEPITIKKTIPLKPAEAPIKKILPLNKPKPDKKKLAEEKIKKQKIFNENLLADIKKQEIKQKIKQKKLQSQFKKTLQEQAEKSLRQQLIDEKIKLEAVELQQTQGEVNKYKALILQAISQHWIIPTQANRQLYCELMIRIAPGGMVLDVQVTKSSGDPSLDSSARAAVLKASPLPVPSDTRAFEAFKQFVLKVKPENILEG